MGHRLVVPDQELGWRGAPGISTLSSSWTGEFEVGCTHNSEGYRGGEFTETKPEGVFRIICIGDSYTYGGGVKDEETYPTRLEARLQHRPGARAPVEVINLGVQGYSIRQMRLLLDRMAPRCRPDLVIAAVLPLQVVTASMGMQSLTIGSDGFLLWNEVPTIGRIGNWLHARSRFLQVVLEKPLKRRRKKIFRKVHPHKREDLFEGNGSYEAGWRALEDQVRLMKQTAQDNGAAFALLYVPEIDFDKPDRDYPQRRLSSFCRNESVVFISAQEAVRQEAPTRTLYHARDGHLNAAGYDLVAQVVSDHLSAHDLVP
ncbi:MAG TPA: GDSL-type esterase/lipase family protein [bacterium]|nr:GDSL-type esterase/lipase family protein [bacterium]